MTDACDFPRCRQSGVVIYLGRDLCPEHWQAVASEAIDPQAELELLAKIGLCRTSMGEVVEVQR